MSHSFFSKFTNLYPIQKTLRRELKPLNEHFQHDPALLELRNDDLIARDQKREEDYQAIKPLLDKLHNDFITQSLQSLSWVDFPGFVSFYLDYQKKKKSDLDAKALKTLDENFKSRTATLRKAIAASFAQTAELRKSNPDYVNLKGNPYLSAKSYKILTEAGILGVLEKKYSDDEETLALIRRFGSFFTYFTGFNQNRENYYSDEEKSTAVAYRAINQNLLTFANNCKMLDQLSVLTLSDEEIKVLKPESYADFLTQEGIDHYNTQIASLRSKINEHFQQTKTKLPQPKTLYKQIGSPGAKTLPFERIDSLEQFQELMPQFLQLSSERLPEMQKLLADFASETADLNQIFLSKSALNQLSNRYFANWHLLLEKGVELGIFKYKKNEEESYKLPQYVSLAQLKTVLDALPAQIEQEERSFGLFKTQREKNWLSHWETFLHAMKSDFSSFLYGEQEMVDQEGKKVRIPSFFSALPLRNEVKKFDKTNQEHKNLVKAMLDAALGALRMVKRFRVDSDKLWFVPESEFYVRYDELLEDYPLPKRYDMLRSYLTQKPYSEQKLKLNFDCSTLLNGRDKNKETQNLSVILRKEWKFYLAIMKKDQNKFFEKQLLYTGNLGTMEKMDYKLLPWANKMLPKCLMPGKDKKKYGASDELLALYAKGSFKKSEASFNLPDLHALIDFYKSALPKYEDWRVFDFKFQATENYQDISQFYREVEQQGYLLSWSGIDEQLLAQGVKDGSIYLFQISSKDFNGKSATPDLQTLYRKQIFEKQTNVKLNGEAEIFFRPWSIKKEKKKLKTDNFDVFKNNRYTEDKLLFHVPVTLWFGNAELNGGQYSKFNQKINQELIIPYFDDLHVIGVDRWEKHLAFYSVVSVKTGKIVEQGTLNIINGVDYEAKLSEKAKDRLEARKNRDTIEKIADLKNGYISQVVSKLVDLVLKYHAVIVFEDLNAGFKRGRQKIEQSVYQKLELALAKKLNFIVKKEKAVGEPWSITNAYQLTPQINTFGDIKWKQRGIMFYTRANYTSTTDPLTWWRKTIYLKKWSLTEMQDQFFKVFSDIQRDIQEQSYIFDDGKRKLYSNVERRRGKRDDHWQWTQTKYNPTAELDALFAKYQIEKTEPLFVQLKNRDLPQTFWTSLFRILDLIMQIRNTDDQGRDVIISPIGSVDERFDSRKRFEQYPSEESNAAPYSTSWDANGAFNIARKGIMMLERVRANPERPDLLIRDAEWDEWVSIFE